MTSVIVFDPDEHTGTSSVLVTSVTVCKLDKFTKTFHSYSSSGLFYTSETDTETIWTLSEDKVIHRQDSKNQEREECGNAAL